VMPAGWIQGEAGAAFTDNGGYQTLSAPAVLLRMGITRYAELRAGCLIDSYDSFFPENYAVQQTWFAGMKVPIYIGEEDITRVSFIGHISLESSTISLWQEVYPQPDFRFAIQHSLTSFYALSYNLGCSWSDGYPQYIYTLSNGFALGDSWGCFVELFGDVDRNFETGNHMADGGITFLATDDLQLDISGGFGLTELSDDWFVSGGVSFRLPYLKSAVDL